MRSPRYAAGIEDDATWSLQLHAGERVGGGIDIVGPVL